MASPSPSVNGVHFRYNHVLGLAVGLFLMVGANLMLLAALFFIPSTPVSASVDFIPHTIHADGASDTCPGEVLAYTVNLKIVRPSVVEVTEGFIDLNTNQDPGVGPTEFESRVKPFVGSSEIERELLIPDLPPGDYAHVVGVTSKNLGSAPAFLIVPFTIGDECGE